MFDFLAKKNVLITTCKKYTFLLFLIFIILSLPIDLSAQHATKLKSSKSNTSKYNLSYKIINSEQGTFGYEIYDNKQKMIYQPSIPGMPGNKGFKRKVDAEKIAKLVVGKINRNEMPPTVTKKEMMKLKVKL